MLRLFISLLSALLLFSCSAPAQKTEPIANGADKQLVTRLNQVHLDLGLSGHAFAVIRKGSIVQTGVFSTPENPEITETTPLRFASVTKALTGILLAQLADDRLLDLDASVGTILTDTDLPDAITLRHLAAHVSEGEPGSEYVYGTQRFAMIEAILENVTGERFEALLKSRIVEPAGMDWYDSPYLGSHAGFVSTVQDMGLMAAALQRGELITEAGLERLKRPFPLKSGKPGPVGLGFFVEELGGEKILWSFGQDDPDHSSALFLHLPDRQLSFVLLANTDALSNPFRLMMGDVRVSAFAQAFLDAYAPDLANKIAEPERKLSDILKAAWREDFPGASTGFETLKTDHPDAFEDPDRLVLHFAAMNLQGGSEPMIDRFNTLVLDNQPHNKWVLLAATGYLERTGREDEAFLLYQRIIDLQNQEEDGLRRLFVAWAYRDQARIMMGSDLNAARDLLEKGLATGVTGQTRQQLIDLKNGLAQP